MAWGYSSVPTNTKSQPCWSDDALASKKHDNRSSMTTVPLSESCSRSGVDLPSTKTSPKQQDRKMYRSKRCMDYGTTVTLVLVWSFLLLGSFALLYAANWAASATSSEGAEATFMEIAVAIAISSAPILFATVSNEVLVDQCWRRVVYSALGSQSCELSNKELARNLRAANFEWLDFVKRLFKRQVTRRDLRSLVSYAVLRWGTAASIASVQFCVSWTPVGSDAESTLYSIHQKYPFLVVPIALHAFSIFGAMSVWFIPPWTFFSDRFNDHGLLGRYAPYLERVSGGSIARYDAVAEYLESQKTPTISLSKKHKPGIQFKTKLRGIWFGLFTMCIPPLLISIYFRFTTEKGVPVAGATGFIFHFAFLAQNILYLLALDFVVWNISLEGFCKRDGARPNKSLRHLGHSSGIILLSKALRQRKPVRASLFLWLFWIQASIVRLVTITWTMTTSVLSYASYGDDDNLSNSYSWMKQAAAPIAGIYPLFLIWLLTQSEAPVCEQDGWRWAKIAQDALKGPGFYGVRDGEAVWDVGVLRFTAWADQELR